jgi:hypothetical protein
MWLLPHFIVCEVQISSFIQWTLIAPLLDARAVLVHFFWKSPSGTGLSPHLCDDKLRFASCVSFSGPPGVALGHISWFHGMTLMVAWASAMSWYFQTFGVCRASAWAPSLDPHVSCVRWNPGSLRGQTQLQRFISVGWGGGVLSSCHTGTFLCPEFWQNDYKMHASDSFNKYRLHRWPQNLGFPSNYSNPPLPLMAPCGVLQSH